jgi:hypothetical protein
MAKSWAAFKKALAMSTPIVHGVKDILGTVTEAVATENPEVLVKAIPQIRKMVRETEKAAKQIAAPQKKKKNNTKGKGARAANSAKGGKK